MADQGLLLEKRFSRREVLRTIGGGALALGAADLLAACGEIKGSSTTSSGTIVIGYVSPQTGALAGFASGDNFVLSQVRGTSTYKNGLSSAARPTTSRSSSRTPSPARIGPRRSPAS